MNRIRIPLLLSALAFGAVASFAQTAPAAGAPDASLAKADATLAKLQKIDLLGKIIPLAMTKAQIRNILPALEKARAKEKEIRKLDADELNKLDAEATKEVDAAVNKNEYPSRDFQNKISKTTKAIAIRRQIALGEMVDMVFETIKKELDAGQLKVMAETLKPGLVDPSVKVESMDDAAKQKFFIRYILLDNLAYELLTQMSKGS